MNYVELAEQALTQPPDSYFSNDNLWYSHGMSGINVHRDSNVIDRANFIAVMQILTEDFGKEDVDGDWFVIHCSHWAVGWVDQIMVRILKNPDDGIFEDNITDIFKICMDIVHHYDIYPILDENIYDELLTEDQLSEINNWNPVWIENFDAAKVHQFFRDNEIWPYGDGQDSWFWGPELISAACYMLGMFDPEDNQEIIEEINTFMNRVNHVTVEEISMRELLVEFMEKKES